MSNSTNNPVLLETNDQESSTDQLENSSERTLFVGDLSYFCEESHLKELFSKYGEVLNLEIKRGKSTGESLMHGFVEMNNISSAESAMVDLNETLFMGRRIRICWAYGATTDSRDLINKERENWIQLHVSFVTRQVHIFYPCLFIYLKNIIIFFLLA